MIISCSERIMDHPGNAKRGGVCIYYKETLALKVISIPYLNESLLCEVTIRSKKCTIGTVYRYPSQNSDELESFLLNFEFLPQDISNRNSYLTLLLGDYNARNTKWCHHDTFIHDVFSRPCMILLQQLKEFNLKLPQLFTCSNN